MLWVAVPLAGVVWTALRYRRHWYFYDAWIRLVDDGGGWSDLFETYNDQLLWGTNLAYRIQRSWFGLDDHLVVYAVFCLSLVALHVVLAVVLRRLGLTTLLALLTGGLLVYLGVGAENALNEFNLSHNLGLAVALGAAVVALGDDHSTRSGLLVAGLLLAALPLSSSLTTVGLVYVAVLVVGRWPRSAWAPALAPPAVVTLGWLALAGGAGDPFDLTVGDRFVFARELTINALAALAGVRRGSTDVLSQREAALFVLLVVLVVVVPALVARRVDRLRGVNLIAGLSAAAALVAVLTLERAGVSFFFSGAEEVGVGGLLIVPRYVQWVAIFLALAVVPVAYHAHRPTTPRDELRADALGAALIAMVFLVGLGPFRSDERYLAAVSAVTKASVAQAVTLVEQGCPPPGHLIADRTITDADLLTVEDLATLVDRGAFPDGFSRPPDAATTDRLCQG